MTKVLKILTDYVDRTYGNYSLLVRRTF